MADQSIICPHCKREILLTQALTHPIEERLRNELDIVIRKRDQEHAAATKGLRDQLVRELETQKASVEKEAREKARGALAHELKDLQNQVNEKNKLIEESHKQELDFRKRERAIIEREESVKLEIQRLLDEEREKIRQEAVAMATQQHGVELNEIKEILEHRTKLLDEAKDQEVGLRKRQRELEERERGMALELERKLDEQVNRVREDAIVKATEEHRLRDREKDKQLEDLRKQIEDLKRKAEQGSQQTQGEAQELELEDILREHFRFDEIEPISKGQKGADVIHKVCTDVGKSCGVILWESKRTKSWSDGWLQKLKDDQRHAKADFAVIVSSVLPKGISHIGRIDGIWVCDFSSFVGLGTALRFGALQVAQAKNSLVGKEEKMEIIYQYLSGPEFRHRIEAIIESFVTMKDDLDSERRVMERTWAKREKQIQRVLQNTSGMWGDLQGLIGTSFPTIPALEVKTDEDQIRPSAQDGEGIDVPF